MTTKVLLLTAGALLYVGVMLMGTGNASPIGAPDAACQNMTPMHGVPEQENPSPYTTSVTALGGTRYSFVLTGTAAVPFKGVMVQARDENDMIVGMFEEAPGTDLQLLNCLGGLMNSVTHTESSEKTRMEVVWDGAGTSGTIMFHYTSCFNGTTFWTHELAPLP